MSRKYVLHYNDANHELMSWRCEADDYGHAVEQLQEYARTNSGSATQVVVMYAGAGDVDDKYPGFFYVEGGVLAFQHDMFSAAGDDLTTEASLENALLWDVEGGYGAGAPEVLKRLLELRKVLVSVIEQIDIVTEEVQLIAPA